jgi:hypothetical protein
METTLAKLINSRLECLAISKAQLVTEMGYKNSGRGMSRLNRWLNGTKLPYGMEDRLASALQLKRSEIDSVIEQSKQQLKNEFDEKQRKVFEPHLFAMCTKSMPSPIFVGVFMHKRRIIELDKAFLKLEYIDQLSVIKSSILQHFEINEGGIPGFGWIRYYVLEKYYDQEDKEKLAFNTDGTIADFNHPNLNRDPGGPGSLRCNGKNLGELF